MATADNRQSDAMAGAMVVGFRAHFCGILDWSRCSAITALMCGYASYWHFCWPVFGTPVTHLPAADPFSLTIWLISVEQIIFGLLFGLCLHALFMILTMAGHIISQQMGLSMAIITDPVNGESDPIISELLYVLCVLLFFALNGHLVMLDVLVESLRQWPPGQSLFELDLDADPIADRLVDGGGIGDRPLTIAAMLLVNLAFGVMNRSAPAFNIFSLGFPMSMLAGLLGVWAIAVCDTRALHGFQLVCVCYPLCVSWGKTMSQGGQDKTAGPAPGNGCAKHAVKGKSHVCGVTSCGILLLSSLVA